MSECVYIDLLKWSWILGQWSMTLYVWGLQWELGLCISLLKPRRALWLSGLFSLTGRWKPALVFGHGSLRENLDWDIDKGLKSEGNHFRPIAHAWKRNNFSGCCSHKLQLRVWSSISTKHQTQTTEHRWVKFTKAPEKGLICSSLIMTHLWWEGLCLTI